VSENKPWYQSLTIWFNVLGILVGVAMQFGFAEHQPAEWTSEVILLVVTGVNLALRVFRTNAPIG